METHTLQTAECPVCLEESAINETLTITSSLGLSLGGGGVLQHCASGYSAAAVRGSNFLEKSMQTVVNGVVERAVAHPMKLVISSQSSALSHLIADKVSCKLSPETFWILHLVVPAAFRFHSSSSPVASISPSSSLGGSCWLCLHERRVPRGYRLHRFRGFSCPSVCSGLIVGDG